MVMAGKDMHAEQRNANKHGAHGAEQYVSGQGRTDNTAQQQSLKQTGQSICTVQVQASMGTCL